jgi:hypothetical protein
MLSEPGDFFFSFLIDFVIEEAETNPIQKNNIKLQENKARYLITKLECQRMMRAKRSH